MKLWVLNNAKVKAKVNAKVNSKVTCHRTAGGVITACTITSVAPRSQGTICTGVSDAWADVIRYNWSSNVLGGSRGIQGMSSIKTYTLLSYLLSCTLIYIYIFV